MPHRVDHLAPFTDDLLRLAIRGLSLPNDPRVLDLCCGIGSASHLLTAEFGAHCTGVDANDSLLRIGRERALAAGLQDHLEFRQGDARHIELPNGSFDLVLALGGTLTYVGRLEGLERIRQLLKPAGALLLSDLVYLDSPVPDEVKEALANSAPGNPIRSFEVEPAVRAVYEEGIHQFETEASYRGLLEAVGFQPRFTFEVPESVWNAYYRSALLSRQDPGGEMPLPVENDEIAAYYCWGGRWKVGYLVCGAKVQAEGI